MQESQKKEDSREVFCLVGKKKFLIFRRTLSDYDIAQMLNLDANANFPLCAERPKGFVADDFDIKGDILYFSRLQFIIRHVIAFSVRT